jgi:glycosyltransferase involved in cell wall biosynthesis
VRWQILAHDGGGIPAKISAHPWAVLLLPFFLLSMFTSCLWHARKNDVIFANWSICGVIAGIAGSIIGRPIITTIRGEDANRAKDSRIYRLLISLCFRLNKRVVTVSDDIAGGLLKLYPSMKDKIVMIPNGVDFEPQRMVNSGKTPENRNVRLLMVGSLIPRKSVSTALHALELLPAEFSLTLVGDGPERENLDLFVKNHNLEGRVCFVGQIHPDEISSWLSRSDVLLMTSKSEGRPNAVLEALAAGVPVVGSDIPGIRELILPDVNGLLFPCGDYKMLSARLLSLADREFRLRLGEEARKSIIDRGLTWEKTADRYLQEIKQLCGKEKI